MSRRFLRCERVPHAVACKRLLGVISFQLPLWYSGYFDFHFVTRCFTWRAGTHCLHSSLIMLPKGNPPPIEIWVISIRKAKAIRTGLHYSNRRHPRTQSTRLSWVEGKYFVRPKRVDVAAVANSWSDIAAADHHDCPFQDGSPPALFASITRFNQHELRSGRIAERNFYLVTGQHASLS